MAGERTEGNAEQVMGGTLRHAVGLLRILQAQAEAAHVEKQAAEPSGGTNVSARRTRSRAAAAPPAGSPAEAARPRNSSRERGTASQSTVVRGIRAARSKSNRRRSPASNASSDRYGLPSP